jgi:hypothetical protein
MRPKRQVLKAGIRAHAGKQGRSAQDTAQPTTSHAHTYMAWSHTTLVCLKHFHHLRVWEGKTEWLKVKLSAHFKTKSNNVIPGRSIHSVQRDMLGDS